MTITPIEIQQKQFKTRFRGFDIREVDDFLEQTANTLTTLLMENKQLREKNKRLELESQGYQKREDSFKRIMLNSQQVIEQMKENAKKSADLIIAEAEVRAEKILNNAHNRLSQLHEDISELKRQRMQIELQIRSIIESHSRLLDIEKEEAQARDGSDSNVKVFTKV